MDNALIRTGHGYETGSRGRCEAFDGITILARPLGGFSNEDRESRVFPSKDGPGTTYGSHSIALGEREGGRGELLILMQNGSGREVWAIPKFYNYPELREMILGLPERTQYALLHSIWRMASNSRQQAIRETTQKWSRAFHEGRIKKRRRDNKIYIEILPPSGEDQSNISLI